MVGVEVRRFGLETRVAELARRLALPVVTTFMGRGLLAEADLPLHGTYLGLAGDPAMSARSNTADGLLLLGVIVSDTNFAVSARRIDLRHTIHAFDDEVTHGPPHLPRRCRWRRWWTPAGASAPSRRPVAPGPAAPRHPLALAAADDALVQPADIAAALNR
jgi:indolepyruvate decarboxylase